MNDDDTERFTVKDGGDDRIEPILRRAGPRRGLPADAALRLRAAVEAAVERERERRRRAGRVRVWLAAAAVLALLFVGRAVFWPGDVEASTVAHVERAVGTAVAVGDRFAVGQPLATGAGELLALRTVTGHSMRLAPDTRLRFVTPRIVELQRGSLYLDSGDGAALAAIAIETPFGRVEELGTRYLVRLGPAALAVGVRGGQVALDRDGGRHVADAGFELAVGASGEVVKAPIDPHGEAWAWVLDAAPAPAVDGRPLELLLDWVVRETGFALAFEDASTAAHAPAIVVHGSVEGLAPVAALEALLPACGLTYRIESGTLTVGAAPEE